MAETLDKVVIAFIIPAYNEENCIGECIQSIKKYSPNYCYQIIVVDNGSTDHTCEIVKSSNVCLIEHPHGTIASARNRGAMISEADVFIFLDADVYVTLAWQKEIDSTIKEVLKNPLLITGSRCNVADEKNWLSRYWFSRMKFVKNNYINSGHLITSRILFELNGGFDANLHTAEDFDFCMRARSFNAKIINNNNLSVIHTGYPTKLIDFITRERWHGREDFMTFRNIIKSKTAILIICNTINIIFLFTMAYVKKDIFYALLFLFNICAISIVSTFLKFGFGTLKLLLTTSIIFFFYYVGRTLAFVDRLKTVFIKQNGG